jgi:hypothetical protein
MKRAGAGGREREAGAVADEDRLLHARARSLRLERVAARSALLSRPTVTAGEEAKRAVELTATTGSRSQVFQQRMGKARARGPVAIHRHTVQLDGAHTARHVVCAVCDVQRVVGSQRRERGVEALSVGDASRGVVRYGFPRDDRGLTPREGADHEAEPKHWAVESVSPRPRAPTRRRAQHRRAAPR